MTFEEIVQKLKDTFPEVQQCLCVSQRNCKYSPQGAGQLGCAVGIFLDPEDAESLDRVTGDGSKIGSSLEGILDDNEIRHLFEIKYPHIIKYKSFFRLCQRIHDHVGTLSCKESMYIYLNDYYETREKLVLSLEWKKRWNEFFEFVDKHMEFLSQTPELAEA